MNLLPLWVNGLVDTFCLQGFYLSFPLTSSTADCKRVGVTAWGVTCDCGVFLNWKCLCTDNADMHCYAYLERSCGSAGSWVGCFWDKLLIWMKMVLVSIWSLHKCRKESSSLEELCSPWYKFVIQEAEMRNLLNQIFYKEIIRPLLSSQILKIAKLALLCSQELSSWGVNVVWWENLWTWRSRGSMWISIALQLLHGCDRSGFSEV